MALWAAKGLGIMFGGVTDEDKHEETLESVFHNDLYGYQLSGNGRWVSMLLKKPKQEKGKKKRVSVPQKVEREGSDCEGCEDEDEVRDLVILSSCILKWDFSISGKRSAIEENKMRGSLRVIRGRS